MSSSILTMYAVTPCHAGCGISQGVVDLPIQRERHTNWPVIQASGVKGAMRAHFDRYKDTLLLDEKIQEMEKITELIFGSENSEYAGSLAVSDAKVLAYPMRSNFAPFVWITCPAVLKRLNKDLHLAGKETAGDLSALLQLEKDTGWCVFGQVQGRVLLEDMEVKAVEGKGLADQFSPLFGHFQGVDQLLVVHDEVFGYGVSNCTSVMAHIKIDQSKGTTEKGSLRYQEELPADTLMYSVILWGASRDGSDSLQAEVISGYIKDKVIHSHLQIGGDETLGRGIFELSWM